MFEKFIKAMIGVLIIFTIFAQSAIAREPMKLFTNGSIYIDSVNKVDNLLIAKGAVQAYNINPSKFRNLEIIDLAGATLYPGFNDSHVHLFETGAFFMPSAVNMTKCFDSASMAAEISKRIKELPAGKLILGVGFSLRDYDKWNLEDLKKIDDASGGAPVFLGDKLGHNVVVNSAAMKLCSITPQTKAPMGGKIGIENGKLTGMFRESAMTLVGNPLFAVIDKELLKQGAQMLFNRWAAMGYTAIVDLMGSAGGRVIRPEILRELETEGKLPLRVNYCFTFSRLSEIEKALEYVGKDTDLIRFLGCKIFVDGAFAAGQAWTSWKNNQGNNGLYYVYNDDSFGSEFNLNRIVEKLEDLGLNCHYHIQGDQGIETLLNALEAVKTKKGGLKCVHTIIHVAFPRKDQIERMKKFGGRLVTTVQPGFWEVEDDMQYYYGVNAARAYPVKDLIAAGISTGISTDFSVSPIELSPPQTIMKIAVTGGGHPEIHKPLSVKEVICGLSEASAATTATRDTGTLRLGNKADMVVFEHDFNRIPAEKLSVDNPKVLSTWVSGRKVYDASAKK
jgi:predicted amidohydrolase YtcJ